MKKILPLILMLLFLQPAICIGSPAVISRGIGTDKVLDIKTDSDGNIYILHAKSIQRFSSEGKGIFRDIDVDGVFFTGAMTGRHYYADPKRIVGDALYYDEEENQMYLLAYFDDDWKFMIYKVNDDLTLEEETNCRVQSKSVARTSWAGDDFLTRIDNEWFYSSCEGVASVFYHIYNPYEYYTRLPINAVHGDAEAIVKGDKVYILSENGYLIYYNIATDESKFITDVPLASDMKITSDGNSFYYSCNGTIFKVKTNGSISLYISQDTMNLFNKKFCTEDDLFVDGDGNLIYTDRGFLRIKHK